MLAEDAAAARAARAARLDRDEEEDPEAVAAATERRREELYGGGSAPATPEAHRARADERWERIVRRPATVHSGQPLLPRPASRDRLRPASRDRETAAAKKKQPPEVRGRCYAQASSPAAKKSGATAGDLRSVDTKALPPLRRPAGRRGSSESNGSAASSEGNEGFQSADGAGSGSTRGADGAAPPPPGHRKQDSSGSSVFSNF